MAERIDLEVPATLTALSTVRLVLGGLGARLDFSLDDLEDLYLATDELLRTALDADALDRLSVEVLLDDGELRFTAGTFRSAKLRADVTTHAEDCLDLCMLLRSTVDDVVLEDEHDAYRVVLVKRRKGDPA
jgi:anti-sigma regulatory factor (Ser/Thr protein kinase)